MKHLFFLKKIMDIFIPPRQKSLYGELPGHIAIIMDGNGRWAEQRGLPRFSGHLEGGKRVEEIVKAASEMGVKALTLYTFSTENWKRPKSEVSMIMKTVKAVLDKSIKKLQDLNIQLHFIGQRDIIPQEVLESIDRSVEATKGSTGLMLNMAFNYGSRNEILDAVKKISTDVKENRLHIEQIDEELFSQSLYTRGMPDPDLLIRTSGEKRISNFLLWQLSYAEIYFTDKYWPDFTQREFQKAIIDYQNRERRYGKVMSS